MHIQRKINLKTRSGLFYAFRRVVVVVVIVVSKPKLIKKLKLHI